MLGRAIGAEVDRAGGCLGYARSYRGSAPIEISLRSVYNRGMTSVGPAEEPVRVGWSEAPTGVGRPEAPTMVGPPAASIGVGSPEAPIRPIEHWSMLGCTLGSVNSGFNRAYSSLTYT